MLKFSQFTDLIVTPALSDMQMYSDDAKELLVFTCAVESQGGTYIHQVKGPALGIYQMEPNTYTDIWVNYLYNQTSFLNIVTLNFNCPRMPLPDRVVYDLKFATCMARLHYRRVKEQLPNRQDLDALWDYYKEHYNTSSGKAKKDKAIKLYQDFLAH